MKLCKKDLLGNVQNVPEFYLGTFPDCPETLEHAHSLVSNLKQPSLSLRIPSEIQKYQFFNNFQTIFRLLE